MLDLGHDQLRPLLEVGLALLQAVVHALVELCLPLPPDVVEVLSELDDQEDNTGCSPELVPQLLSLLRGELGRRRGGLRLGLELELLVQSHVRLLVLRGRFLVFGLDGDPSLVQEGVEYLLAGGFGPILLEEGGLLKEGGLLR